jgi:hypothetical protein
VLDGEKGDHWWIVDGLITSHDRVFVPVESSVLPDLLAHAHGCGHEGTEKTLHRLRADFQVSTRSCARVQHASATRPNNFNRLACSILCRCHW